METLLVTRFISGFLAAVPVTNCGGVIADIWSAAGRGPAMSLFTASVFLGPVLGPVISGLWVPLYYLNYKFGSDPRLFILVPSAGLLISLDPIDALSRFLFSDFLAGRIIQADASWRWIFWVMMFFTAAITLLVVPFFPETYAPVILLYKVFSIYSSQFLSRV